MQIFAGSALKRALLSIVVFAKQLIPVVPAFTATLTTLSKIAWPWYVLIGTTVTVGTGILSSLTHPQLTTEQEAGRTFTPEDLRDGCAVVLSDKFWRGPIGGDPAIVGQSLSLDGRACNVVGVMPAGFSFYPPETQVWSLLLPGDPRLKRHFGVFMVARLRPGVTLAQAQSELASLHAALHANDSSGEESFTPLVSGLQDQFIWLAGRNLRTTLGLLSSRP